MKSNTYIRWLLIIILFGGILMASCGTPKPILNPAINIDTLYLRVHYDNSIDSTFVTIFDQRLNNSISRFNKQHQSFRAIRSDTASSHFMNIEIDTIRIVSSGNVTGSAIASTIGLVGLPLLLLNTDADFVIFFWVTPMNYTKMTVSLSTNINKSKLDKIPMAATSSGYFANYEKRTIRQSKAFEDFLYHLLMQMEYKYDMHRQ